MLVVMFTTLLFFYPCCVFFFEFSAKNNKNFSLWLHQSGTAHKMCCAKCDVRTGGILYAIELCKTLLCSYKHNKAVV